MPLKEVTDAQLEAQPWLAVSPGVEPSWLTDLVTGLLAASWVLLGFHA